MEIQKIFSNVEEPDEMLYSVLMSEDEVALFSEYMEEQREFASIRDAKKALNIAMKASEQGGLTQGQVRSVASKTAKMAKGNLKALNNEKVVNKIYGPTMKKVAKTAGIADKETIKGMMEAGINAGKAEAKHVAAQSGKLDPGLRYMPRIKK